MVIVKNKQSWFALFLISFLVLINSCASSPSSDRVSRKATQLSRSEVNYNSTEVESAVAHKDAKAKTKSEVVLNDNTQVADKTIAGYSLSIQGQIVRVSDGDTVVLLDEDKIQHRVRLDGIDCPESKQAYGTKATQFVREKLGGGKATVYYNKKDRYGRLLGVLINSSGENINELLLANGLAWHYKHYNKNPIYTQLEQDAKDKRLNIWSEDNPIEPYEFRKMQRKKK
mgnify:CR=1 FL=1